MGTEWDDDDHEGGADRRPPMRAVIPDRRELIERARRAIARAEEAVTRSESHTARAEELILWSQRILDDLGLQPEAGVGAGVERMLALRSNRPIGPLAVVGSTTADTSLAIDETLLARFGHVAKVFGGLNLLSRVIVEQPDVAVVLDDLSEPAPMLAARLIRLYAPDSAVLVIGDDRDIARAAAREGVARCPSSIPALDFEELLDDLVA